MRILLLGGISIVLLVSLIWGGIIVEATMNGLGFVERGAARGVAILRSVTLGSDAALIEALQKENERLRAKVEEYAHSGLGVERGEAMVANIYVRYPWNDKGEITIALGERGGVRVGDVVLSEGGTLLGQVTVVGVYWSTVRTIFDPLHTIAVRVGQGGVPALLRGGGGVTVSMIDQSRTIADGDGVYVSDKMLPYGIRIGSVAHIRQSRGIAFQEADVELPYRFSELERVLIRHIGQ